MSGQSQASNVPRILTNPDGLFKQMKQVAKSDAAESASTREQIATEKLCRNAYKQFLSAYKLDPDFPPFHKDQHVKFLLKGIRNLPSAFECLDSSRPWILYWILHALCLLDAKLNDDMVELIVKFLRACQSEETGGFGGGPGQIAHLATTYAAVNALCTLNTCEALDCIDVDKLLTWIQSLKMENGAFRMHKNGEEDLRGTYCAISVAKLCDLESRDPSLFDGCADSVRNCQTYEGGFGATPFNEAHGGYSFCGLAALKLLGKEETCDIKGLTRWLVNKQMTFEGGFQGRTNKLVDACYSFWQAGMFPTIHSVLMQSGSAGNNYLREQKNWLFDAKCLQEYILMCCQQPNGGIVDKPGKNRDYYHLCYSLSGLSISQNFGDKQTNIGVSPSDDTLLNQTHPLFNVCVEQVYNAISYFKTKSATCKASPQTTTTTKKTATKIEEVMKSESELEKIDK